MELGRVGVWSGAFRNRQVDEVREGVRELEELGYGTIWFPGGEHAGLAERIEMLLDSTRTATIATGIVSVWTHPAKAIAAMHADVSRRYPGRFLLGLGISHQHVVERAGITYEKPLARLRQYLDELDAAPIPVPVEERILASLGPISLKLARQRSLGTHPYFVPVEHTRIARQAVGPGKIVAPEQMVVVESNPERARAIAREAAERYLNAPNYTNNLLRLGFAHDEFQRDGSDRLVDAIVAWGEPEVIMQRVREHHQAGADHVCIQVLTEPQQDFARAMDGWRRLAPHIPR
jgi:probable F420-dependent oxidoreductase